MGSRWESRTRREQIFEEFCSCYPSKLPQIKKGTTPVDHMSERGFNTTIAGIISESTVPQLVPGSVRLHKNPRANCSDQTQKASRYDDSNGQSKWSKRNEFGRHGSYSHPQNSKSTSLTADPWDSIPKSRHPDTGATSHLVISTTHLPCDELLRVAAQEIAHVLLRSAAR